MPLTKPRAYQIFNLDYKQAVRVLTDSNVTLTGGAPSTVDGINLAADDRVLVRGQNTGSQNGIYIVDVLGTGSNGTWVRAVDANQTGEIQAGMIVMVTEGNTYKDTQWKLTTNDPIDVGVTALTFELNTSTNQILNGNTNITISDLGANANVTVNGTANVAVFTSTGLVANNIATEGNVTVGNNLVVNGNLTYINVTDLNVEDPIIGLGRGPNNTPLTTDDNKDRGTQLWYYTTAERSAFVGWDDSAGKLTMASNVSITNEVVTVNNYGNITTGNIEATGNIVPTANITYDLGTTSARWRDLWLSNSTIYIGEATIGAIGNTLTINGSNVLTGNAGSAFSTTGNVTGGNILTAGVISATGNITGNYVFGNGSQLTGLSTLAGATGVTGNTGATGVTGNTGATGIQGNIGATGGIGATGVAGTNGATGVQGNVGATGATGIAGTNGATGATGVTGNVGATGAIGATGVTGNTGATGTFNGTLTANVDGNGFNISNVSAVLVAGAISASGNVNAGNVIAAGLSGTLTTAAQTNITLLGTLSSLSVTGNVDGGNIKTIGLISASGNVNGGNVVASADIIGGNIRTVGIISATGNITGNYIFGNGSQLTGLQSFVGATGPQGIQGNIGATGTQGIQGNIGATGASGIQGIQGNIGATGTQGIQGNIGATGVAGNIGATGTQGIQGNIGATGVAGNIGATGVFSGTLTANINGAGFSISNVATVAATTLISSTGNVQGGNIRTVGIISATGNITGNFIFGNGSQLTGVTGNIGATGPQGATGVTGGIGATGATGVTGGVGATGATGVTGGVGATGATGVTGGVGATGATGVQGNIGATGVQGNIGATGTIPATLTANINGGGFSISNVAVLAATTLISSTGNIAAGNLILSGAIVDSAQLDIQTSAANANIVLTPNGTGNINMPRLSVSGNVTAGNIYGTLRTAAQTAITSVGTLSSLSVTGNVQGGNLRTAGLISATSTITGSALTVGTGNVTCGNIVNSNANGVGNIGSASLYFNTVFAKATSAQYADLAEMYVADADYAPGTLVEFGGANEVTITTQSHSTRVAGIVSTNPSYLMNAAQPGDTVVPVALTGRVPCSVVGTIEKGDRLVASDIPGVAQRLDPDQYQPACIVGKALENYQSDQPGVIEVAVGRT